VAEIATQISSVMPNSKGLPGVSLCGRTSVMRTNVGPDIGSAQVTQPAPVATGQPRLLRLRFTHALDNLVSCQELAHRRLRRFAFRGDGSIAILLSF
jgi:hypothetical protein